MNDKMAKVIRKYCKFHEVEDAIRPLKKWYDKLPVDKKASFKALIMKPKQIDPVKLLEKVEKGEL